ncbi:hypothetical protein AB0O95_12075 [Rhodoglobus sp. NPDC076762]
MAQLSQNRARSTTGRAELRLSYCAGALASALVADGRLTVARQWR